MTEITTTEGAELRCIAGRASDNRCPRPATVDLFDGEPGSSENPPSRTLGE